MRNLRFLEVRSPVAPRQVSPRRSVSRFGTRVVFFGAVVLPIVAVSPFLLSVPAHAQIVDEGVKIAYPLPSNTLTGASKILFSGLPDGGYASIYIDLTPTNKTDAFRTATTQTSYDLDTSALSDGTHTLTIVSFSASGRQVGSSTVTFNVTNTGSAGVSEDSVLLANWTNADVTNPKVYRYRIFAESNATITGGTTAVGGGGGLGGEGGAAAGGGETVTLEPAPLDHQVDILVRRATRDVGMMDNSANIRLIVQEGFARDREGSGGGGSGGGSGSFDPNDYPVGYKGKGHWEKIWHRSLESSQAYTKMIKQNGEEINATKKPSTLPMGDILPTFPSFPVQKGATWNADLTFVGELTKRAALRLSSTPTTLASFENVATPAGFERRCARVEVSQVALPDDMAKSIARALQTEAGSSKDGSSGGDTGSGAGGVGGGRDSKANKLPDIVNYRATLTRVLWFDIAAHQLVRSEDTVDAFYEEVEKRSPGEAADGTDDVSNTFPGIGAAATGNGTTTAKQTPKTVTYNMKIVKFLDDRLPNPTGRWTGGLGTAHSRDNARDPSIARANSADVNNR